MAKMDNDEFETILDNHIQEATHWTEERLSADRETAYRYYLGQMSAAPEGRSQARSYDVFETIESALPDFIEIFLGGDIVAEYEPVGPEDEEFAKQATDYVNHIFLKQNPGFLLMNTWIKDALLSKVGVVRAYWAKKEKTIDRQYNGIDEDQLTQLLDDDDTEVLERETYNDPVDEDQRKEAQRMLDEVPPEAEFDPNIQQQVAMIRAKLEQPKRKLYNVKIRTKRESGRIYIDNVQPENFIVTPRAKTLDAADIVGELKTLTRSDMLELGYKESDVEEAVSFSVARSEDGGIAQIADHDYVSDALWNSPDESTEQITVFDGFIRIDYDGDGIAEWREVVRAGNVTLHNEPCDGPDFVTMTPILIPHRLIGLSLADVVAPLQETSTALTRQYIDGLMLSNNPRTYAVEGQVNYDDLLNNRVGGVVRVKSQGAVGPLITNASTNTALEGLEFLDSRRELRTGITRYNQGLDADSLNKTATGVTKIMSAGDARKRMMARILAETGVKDLFRLLLKLVVENQDRTATIRLRNEWVDIDPSPWPIDMDVTPHVGRGSGDKSELIGVLQMVLQAQKEAMQAGLPMVGQDNLFNTMSEILQAAGIKNVEKFFKDPARLPPQDPNAQQEDQDPQLALAQATVEAENIKAQVKMQELQAQAQIKAKELQMKEVELQIKQAELQLKQADLEIKRAEAEHEARIAEHEAQMKQHEQQRKDLEFLGKASGAM